VKPSGSPSTCPDADLESNNTLATATSLDSGTTLYGLAICPDATDVDYYTFTLTETKKVSVVIQYDVSQGVLSAELDDSNGDLKVAGTASSTGLQITGIGFPAGTYYLKVSAGPDGTINNYEFQLSFFQ
jgi:hypothetical protein